MARQSISSLKSYFAKGSIPTAQQFAHLIDSAVTTLDKRDKPNAQSSVTLDDGAIVVLEGLAYQVDHSAVGTASATKDLGVDGLVPFSNVSALHFGAKGDGLTDNTTSFNRAIAYCRDKGMCLYIPEGTYLLRSLNPLFSDRPANQQSLKISGAGRDQTILRYQGNLGAPLFDASPDPAGKFGILQLTDFTIDGQGQSGVAIYLNHMMKCHFRSLSIKNVSDIGVLALEWWDSTLLDVYLHTVGNAGNKLPAIRMKNRDVAVSDSSCNNIGFYDVHIERHPYRAIELFDTTRQITFNRLKCHHDPGSWPALGTDHVVLDARNVAAGGGYNISFLGCNFAACSGSAVTIQNTGGSVANGFRGVSLNAGGVSGTADYGVKVLSGRSIFISSVNFRGCKKAAFYLDSQTENVQIDWTTVTMDDNVVPSHYGINGTQSAYSLITPPPVGGGLTVIGTFMTLRSPTTGAALGVNKLFGGGYGQQVTFILGQGSGPFWFQAAVAGSNLRLKEATSKGLLNPGDSIRFAYDHDSGLWFEI